MPTPQQRLTKSLRTRITARNVKLRSLGREIDAQSRSTFEQLLGVAATGGQADIPRIDRILRDIPIDAEASMLKVLREAWRWSWLSATERIVRTLPIDVWFRRTAPLLLVVAAAEAVSVGMPGEDPPPTLDPQTEWLRILGGETTRAETIEIIRQLEFPPPSESQVNAILMDTTAEDGLDAMTRIKTVTAQSLPELRRTIVTHMTAPEGTSSVKGLAKDIRPLIHRNPDGTAAGINYKAQRIARTEGVRIAQAGLDEAIAADDDLFDGQEFFNAHVPDSRDDHIAYEGIYRKRDGGWVRGDGVALPRIPLGPNCVLPGQVVGGAGAFNAGLKAWYSGEAIEITTRAGRSLSVTPQHPVLTVDGFVAAGSLHKGSKLLCDGRIVERPLPSSDVADDIYQGPSVIEDVFDSIAIGGASSVSEPSHLDFHGDGICIKGEIDIVKAKWKLQCGRRANVDQRGGEDRPLGALSIRPAAEFHVSFLQSVGDDIPADADLAGELLNRFPGIVSVDEVVDVIEFDFSGHVFDLQTQVGWYSCNSIIIHNCLCWSTPVFADDLTAGLPPVDLGTFDAAQKRFEKERVAAGA